MHIFGSDIGCSPKPCHHNCRRDAKKAGASLVRPPPPSSGGTGSLSRSVNYYNDEQRGPNGGARQQLIPGRAIVEWKCVQLCVIIAVERMPAISLDFCLFFFSSFFCH